MTLRWSSGAGMPCSSYLATRRHSRSPGRSTSYWPRPSSRGGGPRLPTDATVPFRVGTGVDIHAFATGRELWLAGLLWIGEGDGLAGHSDADVVAHAACNALLNAAGVGDLGAIFGTSDPQWSGASGVALLSE